MPTKEVIISVSMGGGGVGMLVRHAREKLEVIGDRIVRTDREISVLSLWRDIEGLPLAFSSHIPSRLDKLGERLRSDRNEQAMWMELLEWLDCCVTCGGTGNVGNITHSVDCLTCKGKGTKRDLSEFKKKTPS